MGIQMLRLFAAIPAVVLITGCAGHLFADKAENRLTTLAAELDQKGDTTSAIALYERAAMAMPNNPDILLALGRAYLRNNDPQSATTAFQQVYRLQEGAPRALLGLGQAALMEGRVKRASDLIAQAAPALNTFGAYNLLGISRTLNGEMDAAMSAFQSAQRLAPANLEIKTNEALAYALSGQPAIAIEQVSAVTTSPLAEIHHTRRAILILMLAGDDKQAIALTHELPKSERASLISRAEHIRDLPTVAEKAAAIGITASLRTPVPASSISPPSSKDSPAAQ
ncbi:tetratricopeptide repeat protein [Bordetella tumulicola]